MWPPWKPFPTGRALCYGLAVPADRPLEEVVVEPAFAPLLGRESGAFCRLANALRSAPPGLWSKGFFQRLAHEANRLESFLDDHGARFNRSFALTRELVASARWLSLAGFSLSHLDARFDTYGLGQTLSPAEQERLRGTLGQARSFLRASIERVLHRQRDEYERRGAVWDAGLASPDDADLGTVRRRLPRNLGQEDPADDSQRVAEIASKFLAACTMLESLDLRVVADANELRRRIRTVCKEEQARVYEATVHNLQSTYDTHIKNTLVETQDERLPRLRGLLSAALHLLETVTVLAHFVERHESEARSEPTSHAIAAIVQGDRVRALMLNELLRWANILMQRGRVTAEELLPSYIELRELRVELPPSLKLHARPAALIVNIVAHHGTPVELEIGTHRCNAGSILEILIGVGSNPEVRHFLFRGDIHPLNDIGLLFESNLGEDGLGNLPAALRYLRER
ncbi:MAG: HPr family phosphocarrier protein [Planctomycetes bacterium]|nr:HPr family phosphocarrier protein [Planctomycetota bacterium]